jgi:Tfp pilus assembly protein PilO
MNFIGKLPLDAAVKQSLEQYADQTVRLQQLKRQAAEIHIRCIAQVRQSLPAEQYSQLLALTSEGRP